MTSNFSNNPMNPLGAPKTALYRPRYRSRTSNPGYELNGSAPVREVDTPGLFTPVQALEEWRAQEDSLKNDASVRWHPDKACMLSVYIAPPPKSEWSPLVLRACQDWESSSAGLIQIQATVRPNAADIVIEWTHTGVTGREFAVGDTRRSIQSPNWIRQAVVSLMTEPEIDKHLSPEQIQQRVYTTVLHEMGHALGLEHSNHKKDVMHHQGWQNPQLSPNDIKRLQELYTKPIPTLFWI